MIEAWSISLSQKIKNADPHGETSVPVMAYAIGVYLNFFITLALTLTAGLITGEFVATLISFISFCVLRMFSGGFHLISLTACTLVSAILLSLIPHIALSSTFVLLSTLLTIVIFVIFAPNMSEETNINPKHYPKMKVVSMCIVASNLFFASDVLALSFLLQGLLILPFKRGGV
ncbi:accessory gene regulator ArgB-like protein [Paenibacillus sp. 2TAB23]|uniref:accessory gene regulator ArgB-like protein n=1 Tax=Paenibacillus sp. 2TAB23 TaxID=3233004 RepID=UPI003F9DE42B